MNVKGFLLVAATAVAGVSLMLSLIVRSSIAAKDRAQTRRATMISCERVHALVGIIQHIVVEDSSPAALKKFTYYREHPSEIKAAQQNAKQTAVAIGRKGDCSPSDLLQTGG